MKQEQSNKLLLIDGHSILNRAFFGLPDLTNAAGLHTNAVYGFLNIMFKIIETEKPGYLTVAFDEHAPTFRHEMFDGYKGTRKPMAEELRQQVPMMKQMLLAMGVTVITKPGLEADDLLGTIARMGEEQGLEVTIVSGDRDLLQLATQHTKISIPKTKKTGTEIENYYAADVQERYLVTPTEFIDVKALMGDTADNIPGVPGIGEKTATAIISEYHSIENAYRHVAELKPPRASKNLEEFYDQAVLSKTLATIEVGAEIDYNLEDALLGDLYTPEAYALCKEWEFKNLLSRFEVTSSNEDVEADFEQATTKEEMEAFVREMIAAKEKAVGVYLAYRQLAPGTEKAIKEDGQLSLFDPPAEDVPKYYDVYGVAFSYGRKSLWMPVSDQMSLEFIKEQLVAITQAGVTIVSDSLKELIKIFWPQQTGRILGYDNAFDVAVADYLLHPLKNQYLLEDMASEHLNLNVPAYSELFAKKTLEQAISEQGEEFSTFACYQAYICVGVWETLKEQLKEQGMWELYHQVELPLVFTLADMELSGIAIDGEALASYGNHLKERLSELEQSIYAQAGEEFNINSPKQLGVILFEKMGLTGGKKTKTGYSTAAEVLETLAVDVPFVADILEYRQLAKLKSTYADGLAHCIHSDGRIRSSFQQTVTATGRISSTEPNLQNIPIRMELGKLIRQVFHPKDGFVFVDADYSQIELRVLSHMSGDENLINAFLQGQDIHRSTASLVFQTPFDEVTELQRRNAKAVNFGIVYGISEFSLAEDIGVSRYEAKEYIDNYLANYHGVRDYMKSVVAKARDLGYTETLYGRKRYIPELTSTNYNIRQGAERIALNTPIQGTAADLIKLAMIRVYRALQAYYPQAALVLQVHDELIIECPQESAPQVAQLIQKEMEQVASLRVPLVAEAKWGSSWYDAK